METFWRQQSNWSRLGSAPQVQAPRLPPVKLVKVRAIARPDGSPSFCIDGFAVEGGSVVAVPETDVHALCHTGKAELV